MHLKQTWKYRELTNKTVKLETDNKSTEQYKAKKKKKFCVSKLPPAFVFLCAFDFAKFRLAFFFFLNYLFFFHFNYEKRRKFAVLEEFKHVGAQKTCKIPFDF